MLITALKLKNYRVPWTPEVQTTGVCFAGGNEVPAVQAFTVWCCVGDLNIKFNVSKLKLYSLRPAQKNDMYSHILVVLVNDRYFRCSVN